VPGSKKLSDIGDSLCFYHFYAKSTVELIDGKTIRAFKTGNEDAPGGAPVEVAYGGEEGQVSSNYHYGILLNGVWKSIDLYGDLGERRRDNRHAIVRAN
jgi:hypothetical protein